MISGIRRTLNVGPWVVALYGSLFGAAAGLLLGFAMIVPSWGSEMFGIFGLILLIAAPISGGVVGLVSVGSGLGLRALLGSRGRLDGISLAVTSGAAVLTTALLVIWVASGPLALTFLIWLPITFAVVGVVWFGFWSRMRSSQAAATRRKFVSPSSENYRSPTEAELRLLRALVERAPRFSGSPAVLTELTVAAMNDGGMGSLVIGHPAPERRFEDQVAEVTFFDVDGMCVSATLNVDQFGELFELDVFKGDFSPLRAVPQTFR
ncbi:hypothetical protein V6245_10700 [Salinibacterium amurskyense]|uniref:DUF6984 family protein n=1 Tax=Salinibacterium amurskyense TaxID=205941 RepID=UPI00311EFF5E